MPGQVLAVGLRPQRGVQFRLDDRPLHVERIVEVHDERDRPAADQRQCDFLPIFFGRVLHDRPALQEGRLVVLEHQAVAGFPDRRLLDIADADLPLAVAEKVQGDAFLVGIVTAGQHGQGLAEFLVEFFIEQADRADLVERHAAQARVGEQIEYLDVRRVVIAADRFLAGFDAQDDAGDGIGGVDLDALAADLVEDLAQCGIAVQVDGEFLQGHRMGSFDP